MSSSDEIDDTTLAQIASQSQARLKLTESPAHVSAAPWKQALDRIPRYESSDPPRSPSTPPSSDPAARNRALLIQAWETVPKHFRWARFDSKRLAQNVQLPQADIAAIRALAVDPPSTLLLVGSTGSGKTTLACAFMRQVIDLAAEASEARWSMAKTGTDDMRGAPPWSERSLSRFKRGVHSKFVASYELVRAADEAPLGQEPRLLRKARRAAMLVLDDLGTDSNHRRRDVVRDLIHERTAHDRPTVITTYLSIDDIRAHYGDGIRRRLAEGVVYPLGR